jgi:hypothetical protein
MRLIGLSAVVLGLLLASAAPIRAATYRTHIARDPEDPYPFEGVTIWMNSDTVFGETAGVEYTIVGTGTYTRVLGIYDNTGWPGANWYAEIPAFPAGTQITYQLFTRNQFGSDYGFTGFNWSYTVRDLPRYVAQLPTVPVLTQSPRVWIASTLTPPGEAGVILDQPGGPIEYTGTYSPTGYPGANWYVDLPARPAGTLVTYHFYRTTRPGSSTRISTVATTPSSACPTPSMLTTRGLVQYPAPIWANPASTSAAMPSQQFKTASGASRRAATSTSTPARTPKMSSSPKRLRWPGSIPPTRSFSSPPCPTPTAAVQAAAPCARAAATCSWCRPITSPFTTSPSTATIPR